VEGGAGWDLGGQGSVLKLLVGLLPKLEKAAQIAVKRGGKVSFLAA
jgi:hypothetical protein